MQRAIILGHKEKPTISCHPARARLLLRDNKAYLIKRRPFTVMLHDTEQETVETAETIQEAA